MRRSAVLLALVLAAASVRAESPCLRGAGRDWRDGPVRYLLTEDEWSRFGRLESEGARAAFIARFWKRLDAGSPPPEGAYRERFEQRCLIADSRFRRDDPPGWRSDRGRVLLLLGEPASVERLPGEAESIAREIWVYSYPAGGVASSLRILFHRTLDGRIRLEPPRAATNVGTPVLFDAIRGRVRSGLRTTGPLRGSALGAVIDAVVSRPAVEPPPRPPRVAGPPGWAEIEKASPESAGLRDGAWFFQAADGSVLALLAVALVPDSGLDAETVRGSVFVAEGGAGVVGGGSRQVPLEPARGSALGRRLHVGRVLLEPGAEARIRYAFTDAGRDAMLVRSRSLAVPELGTGGLSVSSLVPADSFGPLPEGLDSVFAVGSEMVIPRPEASFARGETLRLYLQVYGAAPDGSTGRPRVDVEFRFLREKGRSFVRQGRPFRLRGATGASLGLSIPIGDWPVGPYRVEVELRDRVAGGTVWSEGTFRVTE